MFTTASITPAANKLILAWVTNNIDKSLELPSLSGNGLTWTVVDTVVWGGGGNRTTVLRAMGFPTSGPITVTFPTAQKGCDWSILQFDRVATWGVNGSAAVLQSNTTTAHSSNGADIGITLPSPLSYPGNATVGGFSFSTTASPSPTPGPGYSTVSFYQHGAPATTSLVVLKVPGNTYADIIQGAVSDIGGIAVEVGACANTLLQNGTDPGNAILVPGGGAAMIDAFTFQTNRGTNLVTDVTVTLSPGSSSGIGLIEITDDTGSTVYGSVANPGSDTVTIPLPTNILVTITETRYKIRVTPRSHLTMPAPPGKIYTITAYVSNWTDTNDHTGSDSGGTTVTIDNLSPANVTGATTTPDDQQSTLNWTNPADADLGSIVVLRRQGGAVGDVPVEGETYTAGSSTVGSSSVVCVVLPPATSCVDRNLTNNVTYYYKIFTRDVTGNYSANGVAPAPGTSGSVTPQRYQPDAMIKLAAEGTGSFLADNTYEGTTTTQYKTQGVPSGSPASYHLRLQNDGSTTDSLVITGTGSSASFTVQYLDDASTDRTAAVTGTGYTISGLAAAAYQDWTLKVTPNTAGTPVPGGASYEVFATATSTTNNAKRDQVKAVTTSTSANITLVKSSDKSSYQPGEDITYTTVASNGAGLTSAKNIAIIDPIPQYAGFKIGGATFAAETSTLTGAVSYSNAGTVTYTTGWGYVPVSEGCGAPAGYDYCVTHVKWNMAETTPPGMPSGTSFSMNLVVKVK